MDYDRVRDIFPITAEFAYLNHASVGAPPQPVIEAMSRYLAARSRLGGEALRSWDDTVERIRQCAARFVGAHRDEIVFTNSISHGLNIVATGLDWKAGDNLICAETEFPANIYPWTNLKHRGVEIRFAPAHDNRISIADLTALMDSRTRLVAISFVEFGTGYRNDLDTLGEICHKKGIYLSVDGIQGLGALAFSVSQTPVDFIAAHAAKWMMGPMGTGFLYVRREIVSKLTPAMVGWRSVVHRDDYYCYDSPLRQGGERFEPGSLNGVGLIGMEAAMNLLQSVGLREIEARIMYLNDLLIDGLKSRGCVITTPIAHRHERSGITCFRHPEIEISTLAERLHSAGVIVSLRGHIIRISPHYYNTEDDIERLLAALPD